MITLATLLEKKLSRLTPGTQVELTYDCGDALRKKVIGTVVDNDNEESIEVLSQDGTDLILNYCDIKMLSAQPGGQRPAPEEKREEEVRPSRKPLYEEAPEDILNVNDQKLEQLMDQMPKQDRKKLSGVYDSFRYGVRMSDKSKLSSAAQNGKRILFDAADQDYDWSDEAILFCTYLLRRANSYDHEVPLIGEFYHEAAASCWKEGKYSLSAAYAILAILKGGHDADRNLMILTVNGIVKGNDISGLRILNERLPDGFATNLKEMIGDLFLAKGLRITKEQEIQEAIQTLETMYGQGEMLEELQYWLGEEETEDKPSSEVQAGPDKAGEQTAPPLAKPQCAYGVISRLNWGEHTGKIQGEDGESYTFAYTDIADNALRKSVEDCMRADLGGAVYGVRFLADGSAARQIQQAMFVDRARSLMVDGSRSDRFEEAYALCKRGLETQDVTRALVELVKIAETLYGKNGDQTILEETIACYEKRKDKYPTDKPAYIMNVARCYGYLKQYPKMIEHFERAVGMDGLGVGARLPITGTYLKMLNEYQKASGDKGMFSKMLGVVADLEKSWGSKIAQEPKWTDQYKSAILPYKMIAECGLDRLEEAQETYAALSVSKATQETLEALLRETRERLAPQPEAPTEDVGAYDPLPEVLGDYQDPLPEEEEEGEIPPYEDAGGWNALCLTKREAADCAVGMGGQGFIPEMLAYLRAAANLNPELEPLYRTVALAANDPMHPADDRVQTLNDALAGSDTDYPVLTDYCMGAAFLRMAFVSGAGYDYNAKGLRDSIAVCQQPAMGRVCDLLEEFHRETGRAIDIYADYRNQDVKRLLADQQETVSHAQDLYTKFVLTPAREGVKFARLLEAKKLLFAKDGTLATLLQSIIDQDQEALEEEKESFVRQFLNGVPRFSGNQISEQAMEDLIEEVWEQAGKNMQQKKVNARLQGERRNNLRSNLREVLSTVCRWYDLDEQSAGLTWRTEEGAEAYRQARPRLLEQLGEIGACFSAGTEEDPQAAAGRRLLCRTAEELAARLEGRWKYGQEKFLYVDFLKTGCVMLDQDFMPELSATFCVLPEFNILARIRRHVERHKPSFQEQIDRIYGPDKCCSNYGSAGLIVRYLEAMGEETVTLPEHPERFVEHSAMQLDMRYRSFRETYALAMNYGQIIKSDAFCCTLEDTARYWYKFCKESGDYGFFTSFLYHAENQIHASARQYETQLDEQLDALIASNQDYFNAHPDYVEAIRAQIVNQNFTVAEDWMARIRIGDFSLNVQQLEALGYLESFWNSYVVIYNRVADASRTLAGLLGRREVRNKDSKHAQQLIDNWLSSGNPSTPERIGQLLSLLGWQNVRVSPCAFAGEMRTELYEVCKESSFAGRAAPLHPIAAFGSGLEKKGMYVACLYGIYDCDRIFEKIRALDVIDGSKVILLDYALGQADRRALARKMKQRESGLRNVSIVIDRVLITYLANNYNENLINRILMATAMPFSYCQPYVVDSMHTMPPELFIGRKDELLKIEQPDGVNLIYGGRQLGKSALFKKALSDLDGYQNQRAVLIDIKHLGCADAAKKLSAKLIDLEITPDGEITDDWDTLCRNIERRLRSRDQEIRYFLLMLDEADTFIKDCAGCGYRPLVALKDVQQSLPGQFKYVLAGLHDIVRFNRQVALGNNSVITHMSSLKITPFRTPEAEELLTGPLSYLGFSLPSKVTVSQILATCNYFPGLIQLYAKKLIESVRSADYAGYDVKKAPPYVVSDEHLRRVMSDKEFVDQIYDKFEITLTLDQDEGSCYYPLALVIGLLYNVAPSKSGYTAQDVLACARDFSVYPLMELDEEKIDALFQELQDLNILRSVSNNSYLLASKNFRDLLGTDEEILNKLVKMGGAPV